MLAKIIGIVQLVVQVKIVILGKTIQGVEIKIIHPGIPNEEVITNLVIVMAVNVSNVKSLDILLKIVPMLIIIHPVMANKHPKKKNTSLQRSLKIHFMKTILCIQLVSILKITKIFLAK